MEVAFLRVLKRPGVLPLWWYIADVFHGGFAAPELGPRLRRNSNASPVSEITKDNIPAATVLQWNNRFFLVRSAQGAPFHSPGDKAIYPTVLGIGGAKTGSTALSNSLKLHPQVAVANAEKGGRPCCDSEVYVLLPESSNPKSDVPREGLDFYSRYFHVENKTRVRHFFEKTPRYSSHLFVPYYARALLGPELKLLFTVRDPIEMDISLYFHRQMYKFNVTYKDWVGLRVARHRKWDSCREVAIQRMVVPDVTGSRAWVVAGVREIYNKSMFSWEATAQIEAQLKKRCGLSSPGSSAPGPLPWSDQVDELFLARSLRRWKQPFGNDAILCVSMTALATRPCDVKAAVARFLSIATAGFKPQPCINPAKPHASKTTQRLQDLKDDARTALESLDGYVTSVLQRDGDSRLGKELCPAVA